jgi:hypothetical protein
MRALPGFALVLAVLAGCGGPHRLQQVSVPAVTGIDVAAAECALAQAGLHWRFAGHSDRRSLQSEAAACGGRYPLDDRVCGQRPRARSRVQPGTIVLLRTWNGGSLRERRGCRARRFGHDDPRAVILDVAFEYFRAPKSGAGRRACRLLTSRERARLARREASGCAATINKELGRRLIKGRETVAEVVSMNPKLGTASATVVKMSIRGKPPVIRLRHEHHAWRIVDTHL